jgi:hypothetical protein
MQKLLQVMGLLAVATPLSAQAGGTGFPAGFVVRPDDPAQSMAEISFVTMRPGWHITTGPSAILYDSALQATGSYRVDAETFLFDPGDRLEAYGVLIGGRELTGAGQSYTYFVIRHTGEYLVRRRQGDRTETLVEWTAHPAIMTWEGRGRWRDGQERACHRGRGEHGSISRQRERGHVTAVYACGHRRNRRSSGESRRQPPRLVPGCNETMRSLEQ